MPWKVDPNLSTVEFLVKHLQVTTVRGRFTEFEGMLHMDEENPQESQVAGSIDVASVKTGIGLRDASVRGGGFFNAKQHPQMSFRSTKIGPFEGDRFDVHGELTIRDVTRPVVFEVVDKGDLPAVDGRRRHAFDATLVLSREEFNLKFPPIQEMFGLLVGDRVEALLDIHVVED